MYFCYTKEFDISRARANGVPRISSVSLATFGSWQVSRNPSPEHCGFINSPSLEEGLKDFLNYGFEELRKVEFTDLADGEVENFQRMIAVDIQNICKESLQYSDDSSTTAILNSLQASLDALYVRIGMSPGAMIATHAPTSSAALRDLIRGVISSASTGMRKFFPTRIATESIVQTPRPMLGEHRFESSAGFQPCVIRSLRHGPTLEALEYDDGEDIVSLNGFELDLDDSPLTRRYVRFIQHLAHKYSQYRLQVRVHERTRSLQVIPFVEQDYIIEAAFERFRSHIPCELPENLPLEDKLVMSFMVISQMNLAPRWPVTITDADFHEYNRAAMVERLSRVGTEVNLTPINVGSVFNHIMPYLVEVIWSMGKLKWTHLQSTSLNFPELATFTQNA